MLEHCIWLVKPNQIGILRVCSSGNQSAIESRVTLVCPHVS